MTAQGRTLLLIHLVFIFTSVLLATLISKFVMELDNLTLVRIIRDGVLLIIIPLSTFFSFRYLAPYSKSTAPSIGAAWGVWCFVVIGLIYYFVLNNIFGIHTPSWGIDSFPFVTMLVSMGVGYFAVFWFGNP